MLHAMDLRVRLRTVFVVALGVRLGAVAAGYAAPRALALRDYRVAQAPCPSLWRYLNRRPQCGAVLAEDEVAYDALGRSIAAGRGFVIESVWLYNRPGEPTAYGNFLYPAFVGAVYFATGDSVLALLVLQALLGALAAAGVARAAAGLVGGSASGGTRPGGSAYGRTPEAAASDPEGRRAASWAGILAALHPGLVLASAMVMSEALVVPILVAVYLTWAGFLESPGWRRAALTGALGAAACLTRSPALYALPVMMVAALAGRGAERARRPVLLLAVVAVAALLMAPWAARNAVRFGAFVPTDTKAGGNLWLFNHPSPNLALEVWRDAPDAHPPPAPIEGMNEAQAERHFRRLAVDFIRERPLSVAGATALRLGLFLVPVPRHNRLPALRAAVAALYLVVTWLGLAGLWRARKCPRGRALAGLSLTWVLLLCLTAVGLRHRLSIEWVLVAGAGLALSALLAPRRA